MDIKELSEVIAVGGSKLGNTNRLVEQLKKMHKGVKVTLICHPEDEEKNLEILKEAGLEVVNIKHEDDYKLLPKNKSVFLLNTDGHNIVDYTEAIENILEDFVVIRTSMPSPQQKIDEIEELIKQKDLKTCVSPEAVEDRKYQREQMNQRSRFLSKHCK